MPKISNILGQQAFEAIRDQIAAILADEIDGQGVLTYDPDFLKMQVFVESVNPEDKEEFPFVNVSLATGSWPDLKAYNGDIKGNYIYNIDCYANSPSNSQAEGDNLAGVKLQKILGICRAILENPIYKTLDYAPGFVWRVSMQDLNIRNESKEANGDALNTRMGRLTYLVEVQENVQLLIGQPLTDWTTQVSLNQTNDGYFYQGI